MDILNQFRKELARDWFVQGFSALPTYLNHAAYSGFKIRKILGFGYTIFLFNYKGDYGEMYYYKKDLKDVFKRIKLELKKDPDYLKKLKIRYEKNFFEHEIFFEKLNNYDLKKVSEDELFGLFKKVAIAQIDAVGIAHVVDPFGLEIEKDFRNEISKQIKNKKEADNFISLLSSPLEMSFIAQEEQSLFEIKKLPVEKREEALKKHLKKYFWVQNSYAGPKEITIRSLRKRMEKIKIEPRQNKLISNAKKEKLIFELRLNAAGKKLIKLVEFASTWQDERKANSIKVVHYIDLVADEISRRFKIDRESLNYLSAADMRKKLSIHSLKKILPELRERKNGVFFIMKKNTEISAVGNDYKKILEFRENLNKNYLKSELKGTIANKGKAIGRVVVCKGIMDLKKVKAGDILVASMTRPEFVPILKKVRGIITDEGGLTCHAAIISRELDIPCIVGTKISTKVLKDGDRVDVDANKGVITILNK
ncbi:MAG: PEP-utilizing enzyme [Patescibacteria group bacterium]